MAVTINIPSQVKTYANLAAFPASGSLKTIYIAEDTNKTYRWDGSTYVEISASAATGLTVGTTPISSGTIGRVLFEGTGNVLQQSSSLFWDGTNNRLGIGTSTPASDLSIIKNVGSLGAVYTSTQNTNSGGEASMVLRNDLYYAGFELFGSTFGLGLSNTALFTTQSGITNLGFATLGAANISFRTNSSGANNERLTIFGSTGNIGINTTTDAGFRLDVNGTARVTTSISVGTLGTDGYVYLNRASTGTNVGGIRALASGCEIGGNSFLDRIMCGNGSGINFYTYTGSGTGSNQRMQIFGTTGNVGINTTTDAGYKLDVNGTARVSGNLDVITGARISSIGGASSKLLIRNNSSSGWAGFIFVNGVSSTVAGSELLTISTTLNGFRNPLYIGSSFDNNTNNPNINTSAVLQADSTTQGFLPPRMTNAQMVAIATPAAGLQVYDTTNNKMCVYDGTTWQNLY